MRFTCADVCCGGGQLSLLCFSQNAMFDFGINRYDIREESCHGFHSVPTPCSELNTRISHFASTWISQEWQTLMGLLTAVSDGHRSAIQYALSDRFFSAKPAVRSPLEPHGILDLARRLITGT
jgi:hypothetical protein